MEAYCAADREMEGGGMARNWRAWLQASPGRGALLGLAALLFSGTLAVDLRLAEVTVGTGMAVLGLAGFAMAAVNVLLGGRTWRGSLGLMVMALTPLAVFVALDTHPFGPIPTLPLSAALDACSAAGFLFTDAAPRTDLSVSLDLTVPFRHRPGEAEYVVAPVASPAWTPDAPVSVWVIERGRNAPATWAAAGGLLRLMPTETQDRVVAQLTHRYRLVSVSAPLIGRWVPDPRTAQAAARNSVLTILGGGMLLWVALMLVGRTLRI